MLVEFPRVVDAVRCAVETQRLMVDRNAEVSEDKRITLRTGVNLGDVIIDGNDIYGDGSTSPRDLRRWPNPAASASRRWCATRFATNSHTHSRTWASRASRTSPGRYAPMP